MSDSPNKCSEENQAPQKIWCCCKGHVLGQVVRHNRIRRLELYRQAVQPGDTGDVMAVLTGAVDDIVCSICGDMRSWYAGREALNELLKSLGREELP